MPLFSMRILLFELSGPRHRKIKAVCATFANGSKRRNISNFRGCLPLATKRL